MRVEEAEEGKTNNIVIFQASKRNKYQWFCERNSDKGKKKKSFRVMKRTTLEKVNLIEQIDLGEDIRERV